MEAVVAAAVAGIEVSFCFAVEHLGAFTFSFMRNVTSLTSPIVDVTTCLPFVSTSLFSPPPPLLLLLLATQGTGTGWKYKETSLVSLLRLLTFVVPRN